MPKARMHGDHALDPRGPGTHRRGENPGLKVGAEMTLREQDDIESRAIGRAQDLLRQFKSRIDLAGRQRLQGSGNRLLDCLGADGDVRDGRVKSELHRGFLRRLYPYCTRIMTGMNCPTVFIQ